MAQLTILHYPDPALRRTAGPIDTFDAALKQLAVNLAETMYANQGVGLAATQVGVSQRIIVVDTSQDRDQLLTLVNPEVVDAEGMIEYEEGCLSVPDVYEPVIRPERVRVVADTVDGERTELVAEGLLAICIQHEVEHLDGKLFIDRLTRLKQDRIRKRVVKRGRQDRLAVA